MSLARRGFVAGTVATALAAASFEARAGGEPTLAERARRKGLFYGCSVANQLDKDPAYAEAVAREAGLLVAEFQNQWQYLGRKPDGTADFSGGEAVARFAAAHGQLLRGHALIWFSRLGDPFKQAGSRAEAERALVAHVREMCTHYAGRVQSHRRRARLDAGVLGILVVVSLGACGPKVPPGAAVPVLYQPATARQAYLLQPGDEVEVRFFEVPQLDDRVAVRPDGRVSLQLAGDLDAAGHTVDELHDAMLARYRSILKNPQISVAVRTVAPQRIFVDGEVGKPGVVESPDRITLAMAVAEAGGIKTSAEAKQVLLIRRPPHEARPQVSVLDLAAVQDGTNPSQDVQLATNDVVFVPRSGIGEVNRWVDLYLRQNIPVQFGYALP